jgi:hypothetical protein
MDMTMRVHTAIIISMKNVVYEASVIGISRGVYMTSIIPVQY